MNAVKRYVALVALVLCLALVAEPGLCAEKININTATLQQLDTLPGIGPARAKKIIDRRTKKPFTRIEEIMEVKGIGKAKFNKMKDLITVK